MKASSITAYNAIVPCAPANYQINSKLKNAGKFASEKVYSVRRNHDVAGEANINIIHGPSVTSRTLTPATG